MVNLFICAVGIILCILSIILVLTGVNAGQRMKRYFLMFYMCLSLLAVSNLAGQLLRGRQGNLVRAGLYTSNFVEFVAAYLPFLVISLYLLFLIDEKKKLRGLYRCMWGYTITHVFILLISQFTGLYYRIDEFNVYHRSALYPLSYLFALLMLFTDIYILTRYREKFSDRQRSIFYSYVVISAFAIVLNMFIYGIYFIVLATFAIGVIMYIRIASYYTEQAQIQQVENLQLRVDIMLSQIQPHFLYNTLGVIQSICEENPEKAAYAVGEFSRYLRYNMSSIAQTKPIPFSEEWKHVLCYVNLQKLRFRDALQMQYELECTNFRIPTLTLQPLVENAIVYGVRKRDNGCGLVIIKTREYSDCFEISVIDNGPGFIVETIAGDRERTDSGIRNVHARLMRVCGGELHIKSELGVGTEAKIVLPKGESINACSHT